MDELAKAAEAPPDTFARVLIVDDEPALRRSLARVLVARGMEVHTAEDGESALSILAAHVVDVVLLDLVLPRMSGVDLLPRIRAAHPDVEVVFMTAHASVDAALAAVKAGAYDFLTKPFSTVDVVPLVVLKAAEHKRLISLNRALEQRLEQKEKFGELVGSSQRMLEVYRLALGVASTSTTVLLLGESGTGKELLARAIHQHGARSGRPFIALNCGAIPPELVESELFGHAKGAFTGAAHSRPGLFEAADKGTVFLDEIGELPISAQVKLLRVLENGEIKRIGENEPRFVDVRVIAATNTLLKDAIAAGRFREDLFYRLNVFAILLPALRQRKDDIALLAYHFLHKSARALGRDVKRISVDAMRTLRDQRWPGNVRELQNCIERAVVLCRGDTIMPADLPFGRPDTTNDLDIVPAELFEVPPGWSEMPYMQAKTRVLDAFHKAYFHVLLARTNDNYAEAARQAGLDRANFKRLLKNKR